MKESDSEIKMLHWLSRVSAQIMDQYSHDMAKLVDNVSNRLGLEYPVHTDLQLCFILALLINGRSFHSMVDIHL